MPVRVMKLLEKTNIERIALGWNREVIRKRVNPLGRIKQCMFGQPEHALVVSARTQPGTFPSNARAPKRQPTLKRADLPENRHPAAQQAITIPS
ncbi:MAG: hypothetical protein ACREFP_25650 [Acetobacteraceae bacterium]